MNVWDGTQARHGRERALFVRKLSIISRSLRKQAQQSIFKRILFHESPCDSSRPQLMNLHILAQASCHAYLST